MYFVAEGEVEIHLKRELIRLGAGHVSPGRAAAPRTTPGDNDSFT